MEDLSLGTQIELTVRLVVALLLCAVIGWEREMQRMPAGFRTHGRDHPAHRADREAPPRRPPRQETKAIDDEPQEGD